jgi:hypothetical protein
LDSYGPEEIPYPLFPRPLLTYREEELIVLIPVLLEISAQMKHGLGEQLLRTEKHGDEKTPDPSIPIQERMNDLELVVNESQAHERRQLRRGVKVFFERIQSEVHFVDWGRDKGCILESASRGTNPVLRASKLAWGLSFAPNPCHQLLMDLTNQTKRHRQGGKPRQPILHRLNVVGYLSDVGHMLLTETGSLEKKQVRKGSLSALDSAGKNCFAAEEGTDQEMRIRQDTRHTRELAESSVRL